MLPETLVARIRTECKDGYFAPKDDGIQPFSSTLDEAGLLYDVFAPHPNFGKMSFWLPTELKAERDRGDSYSRRERNVLSLFHYSPTRRGIRESVRMYRDLIDCGYWPESREKYQNMIDLAEQLEIKGQSCIYPSFSGIERRVDVNPPLLFGDVALLREVMGCLKQSSENVLDLFRDIYPGAREWSFVEDNTRKIKIFDLLQRPKVVEWDLS